MCKLTAVALLAILLMAFSDVRAEPAEPWSAERCAAVRQSSQPAQQVQQQLQQYCKAPGTKPESQIIPVQLEIGTGTAGPPPRVQHNSTLETLGSVMLVVLVGFWCWIGRK